MEGLQIYNLDPCHARVSKIFYLVRFHVFAPYQSSKNNIKELKIKNNENTMKINENCVKNSARMMKSNEK